MTANTFESADRTLRQGSVVVPCFNEETNIQAFYQALTAATDHLDVIREIIFVDDGSRDRTPQVVRDLSEKDPRVKLLRFSRNFGSHAAVVAGLRRASGAFAIMISVDLQDPPGMIPELVRQWRAGFHVVWAVRRSRVDSPFKKFTATLFYRILRKLALPEYPPEGMDFGLFDRKVLDALREIREPQPFVTGTLVWLGFRQTTLPYDRAARHSGSTKWNLSKQFSMAAEALASFSAAPVRLVTFAGLALTALGALAILFCIAGRIIAPSATQAWSTVIPLLALLEGVQLGALGILGEYALRAAQRSRGLPQFIIMDEVGFVGEQKTGEPQADPR